MRSVRSNGLLGRQFLLPAVLCALFLSAAAVAAQPVGEPLQRNELPVRMEFSTSAEEPILSYTVVHELLGDENDPTPLVRVYGDGRVLVHRPVFMVDAGDYEMQLSPQELDELMASMAALRVATTTSEEVERQRDQARAVRATGGEMHAVLDASYSVIDIRLETLQQSLTSEALSDVQNTLVVESLQAEARAMPEVAAFQDLVVAERQLRGLMKSPELSRR